MLLSNVFSKEIILLSTCWVTDHGKRSLAGANVVMYYMPTSVGFKKNNNFARWLFLSIKIKPLRFNHVCVFATIIFIIIFILHSNKLYERLLSADISVGPY